MKVYFSLFLCQSNFITIIFGINEKSLFSATPCCLFSWFYSNLRQVNRIKRDFAGWLQAINYCNNAGFLAQNKKAINSTVV